MSRRYVYLSSAKRQEIAEQGSEVTWEDLLARFLHSRRQRTPKYRYDLENGLTRTHKALISLGISHPYQMTTSAAKAWREKYQIDTGACDLSVNHMIQKLMTEFTFAFDDEIFATNLLATLKKVKLQKPKPVSVHLDEINAVVDTIYNAWSLDHAPASRFRNVEAREFFSTRDVCMTLWLPETGSRVGEMSHVQRADIDLVKRTALFRATKNGDDRTAAFGEDFRDGILADWLTIRDNLDTTCDNLFISEFGLPLNPYRWGRQWDKYRQDAGIERRIRRHDLRHFSSQAHDRVSKAESKNQMGHHTDQAHKTYGDGSLSDQELKGLVDAHDQAAPVGPIVARIKAEREARIAAEEAEAATQPKPARTKIYNKK